MSIELTTEMERLITEQLATGRYASVADVVHSALLHLREASDSERELYAAMDDETSGRLIGLDEFVTAFRDAHPVSSVP